jgi:uncharacterized protein with HXXEE motif
VASLRSAVWLLPLAFVIHDGEEVLTMPRWIAGHRALLETIAHTRPLARRIVANLPTTTAQVALAVAVELAVFLAATGLVARDPRPGFALFFYAAVLGAFTAHALTHLGQTLLLRAYTPGVVTAVLVVPPAGACIYKRLFEAGLLSRRSALVSAAAGVVGMVPVLLTAHFVGRVLGAAS